MPNINYILHENPDLLVGFHGFNDEELILKYNKLLFDFLKDKYYEDIKVSDLRLNIDDERRPIFDLYSYENENRINIDFKKGRISIPRFFFDAWLYDKILNR